MYQSIFTSLTAFNKSLRVTFTLIIHLYNSSFILLYYSTISESWSRKEAGGSDVEFQHPPVSTKETHENPVKKFIFRAGI
jgi:hypothetical protein